MTHSLQSDFIFTASERAQLVTVLNGLRQPGDRVDDFLIAVQDGIAEWLKCWPQKRIEAKKLNQAYLGGLSDDLNRVRRNFLLMPDGADPYFWIKVTESIKFPPGIRGGIDQSEWETTRRNVIDFILDLEQLAGQLNTDIAMSKGLNNERKIALIRYLGSSYRVTFNLSPATTRDGTFMALLREATNILAARGVNITIGEDVTRTAIEGLKAEFEVADRYL